MESGSQSNKNENSQSPFPLAFQTNRLDFKPLALSDAKALHELRGENEVMKWSRQKRPDASVQDTEKWLEKIMSELQNQRSDNNRNSESGAKGPGIENIIFSIRERSHLNKINQGEEKEDRIIGTTGVAFHESEVSGKKRYEIGYMLVPRVWGRGYASEAVKGLCGWWDGLGQNSSGEGVYAVVAKRNPASLRVMEKCGFEVVGEGFDPNGDGDIVEFCLAGSSRTGTESALGVN